MYIITNNPTLTKLINLDVVTRSSVLECALERHHLTGDNCRLTCETMGGRSITVSIPAGVVVRTYHLDDEGNYSPMSSEVNVWIGATVTPAAHEYTTETIEGGRKLTGVEALDYLETVIATNNVVVEIDESVNFATSFIDARFVGVDNILEVLAITPGAAYIPELGALPAVRAYFATAQQKQAAERAAFERFGSRE